MKLFKLEIGNTIAYAAAESLEEMHERKSEVDATFAFLPVQIDELIVPGYTIDVTPEGGEPVRRGGRPRKSEA